MKAVVHIGMNKTGSTSIQKTFTASRERLHELGIVYPEIGKQPHHAALIPAVLTTKWNREFGAETPENIKSVKMSSEVHWKDLEAIKTDNAHGTAVISCEHIFGLLRSDIVDFQRRLLHIFDELDYVGYVRSPTSHYLSRAQQTIKFAHTLPTPVYNVNFRTKIRKLERVGAQSLSLRIFSREQLKDGCVCRDFMSNFLNIDDEYLPSIPVVNDNTSVSAEGMALLQEFNGDIYPNRISFGNSVIKSLVRLILAEEQKRTYTKPKLKPEVSALIRTINRDDVNWLRDERGIVFEDTDYDDTFAPVALSDPGRKLKVRDICEVDLDKLDFMRNIILKRLIEQHNKTLVSKRVVADDAQTH